MEKIDYVNLKQGTNSTHYFSTGNTLPLVARPFGMNHWTIQTELNDDTRFFRPDSYRFHGVRLTHQPSPWMKDYASLLFIPQVGKRLTESVQRTSFFRPENLQLKPYELSCFLHRYQTNIRLAPTSRSAICEITFPENDISKRLIFDTFFGDYKFSFDKNILKGYVTNNNGGVTDNFRFYFYIEFDHEIVSLNYEDSTVILELPDKCRTLNIRLGTSFISSEQASINLNTELKDFSIEDIAMQGKKQWLDILNKIEISGSEEQLKTFYSCLYRTALFPREAHEFNGQGEPIHYSPYDGNIHPGVLYSDNGFWDTSRTVYPLFAILAPSRYAEMLQGWTNAAKSGGAFPSWSSPGYRDCMIGTHIDNVFADALVKGINDFEVEVAYEYLKKNAFDISKKAKPWGRAGLQEFDEVGYVPADKFLHGASRTMDYAFNDFGVAVVADYLGDIEVRDKLLERTKNYKNIYNPKTGCLQGRLADGSFDANFNPFEWGGDYVEGSSFQCGFAVQHDIDGMIELFGGAEAFVEKLDEVMTTPPFYDVGSYEYEIHEMTEMAAANFGQYAQSNQPSHHLPWLYTAVNKREQAAHYIERVAMELYSPDKFPGDEDNGEMGAWYIFATLGFYPIAPGKAEYITAKPLVAKAKIKLENGKTITIIRSDKFDKDKNFISHEELMNSEFVEI